VTFHVKHEVPPGLAFLASALTQLREQDLFRERSAAASAPPARCFASNDYLALARELPPRDAAGAGASRLVTGDLPVHARLEAAAAGLVGQPAALAFTSGYAANVGALSALAGSGDLVVSDALNHASIIDGIRLSRARVAVVPHLDVAAVEGALRRRSEARAFVVTESYFSMDGDSPDLCSLRAVCDAHGAALLVDEAHALGVLGPEGRGVCAGAGVRADVVVGTFGKAFGAAGAFVAGCPELIAWLWNRARSFVFSTGLSPAVATAALQGMDRARTEPWRRAAATEWAGKLRRGLETLGHAATGYGHVIPWVVGEPAVALEVARSVRTLGLDVRAIRPPSVPAGTARLRLTATAAHSAAVVEELLAAIAAAVDGR
jgi:8-amino-7-oxononanoate synthase